MYTFQKMSEPWTLQAWRGFASEPKHEPLPTETWTLLTISRNRATRRKTGDKNWRSKK